MPTTQNGDDREPISRVPSDSRHRFAPDDAKGLGADHTLNDAGANDENGEGGVVGVLAASRESTNNKPKRNSRRQEPRWLTEEVTQPHSFSMAPRDKRWR